MCLQSSNCCKPGESLLLLPLLDSRGGPTQPSPSPPRYIDFDMLVADHAKRQRWADLCEHVLIPPLRRMSVVIATKSHLMESTATDVLNKVMPALERQVPCLWSTNILGPIRVAILVCWARGEWERMQPSAPGVHFGLAILVGIHMLKAVSTKEGELIGASTGTAMDTTLYKAYRSRGRWGRTRDRDVAQPREAGVIVCGENCFGCVERTHI